MREWEIKGWRSSDNASPYPEHEQKGHEAQPKAGIPSNHSESVEQTCEYGKMTTPLSTAPQQHPAWRGLEKDDDNITQLKHSQYRVIVSI